MTSPRTPGQASSPAAPEARLAGTLDVSNDTWLETWRPIGPKKSLKKPAAVKAMKAMKAKKAT